MDPWKLLGKYEGKLHGLENQDYYMLPTSDEGSISDKIWLKGLS